MKKVKTLSLVSVLIYRCFLLTPKLLPDLEYSEACSILNIVNGPWIGQPSKGKMIYSKIVKSSYSHIIMCLSTTH